MVINIELYDVSQYLTSEKNNISHEMIHFTRHRALYQTLHVLYFTSATKIKKYLFIYKITFDSKINHQPQSTGKAVD